VAVPALLAWGSRVDLPPPQNALASRHPPGNCFLQHFFRCCGQRDFCISAASPSAALGSSPLPTPPCAAARAAGASPSGWGALPIGSHAGPCPADARPSTPGDAAAVWGSGRPGGGSLPRLPCSDTAYRRGALQGTVAENRKGLSLFLLTLPLGAVGTTRPVPAKGPHRSLPRVPPRLTSPHSLSLGPVTARPPCRAVPELLHIGLVIFQHLLFSFQATPEVPDLLVEQL